MALNKADALTPEQIKEQLARLKRAAKKAPLIVSAATGQRVTEALRVLAKVIERANEAEKADPVLTAAWRPAE